MVASSLSLSASSSIVLALSVSTQAPAGWAGIVYNQYDDSIGTSTPIIYEAIDSKIDDKLVNRGIFRGYTPYGSTQGVCEQGSSYRTSNTLLACHAYYILRK